MDEIIDLITDSDPDDGEYTFGTDTSENEENDSMTGESGDLPENRCTKDPRLELRGNTRPTISTKAKSSTKAKTSTKAKASTKAKSSTKAKASAKAKTSAKAKASTKAKISTKANFASTSARRVC